MNVGVLGATGMVGQQLLKLLEGHPWFTVTFLASSQKSANQSLNQALGDRALFPLSNRVRSLHVHPITCYEEAKKECGLLFSALETSAALEHELLYAEKGVAIVSCASAFRKEEDVPVLIPEINESHLDLIPIQRKNRGWKEGLLVVKPNCSLQSYLTPLYAIHRHYPINRVIITTMQAISGAGLPGVASLHIMDNIIPFIAGEEEKSELEPLKILSTLSNTGLLHRPAMQIAAHCNRVPVLDGHMACVSFSFAKTKPSLDEVKTLWKEFPSNELPSSPTQPIIYQEEENRPQTRLDRGLDKGMATVVGRLRPCPVFDMRFVGLSHNTIRGAAGGAILSAELLKKRGFL